MAATITKLNHYRGETITFWWTGDDTYQFVNDGSVSHRFKMLIYPEGLDMSIAENLKKLRQIDSRDERGSTPSRGDGYVYYKQENENTVFCELPWDKTKDMEVGSYTVELLYGVESRSVVTKNNAFTLVSSLSELVNENYDKINTVVS